MKIKSVQTGVLWVAIAGVAVMLLSLMGYYFYQLRQFLIQEDKVREERKSMVSGLLKISEEKYSAPVEDVSLWDQLYSAVQKQDVATIDECVNYMPETYDAGAVAVFDIRGKMLYDSIYKELPKNIYSFGEEDLVAFLGNAADTSEHKSKSFMLNIDGRLWNYICACIEPTDREEAKVTPPSGYVILIREMIQSEVQAHCKTLGDIDATMFFDENAKNDYINSLVKLEYIEDKMLDYRGQAVAYFCFTYPDPSAGQKSEFKRVFKIVCAEMVLIIILVVLFVNKKITRPLRKISNAFETNQIAPISPLTKEHNEFGQISKMMVDFFEQKEEIAVQNEVLGQQKEEIAVQNEELSRQKEEIESQNERMMGLNNSLTKANKQMTDSITYASRLQQSMLLAHAPKDGWFEKGFTIYWPKDIVGGDFYAAKTMGDYYIAIIGDCTGHGVPGSILSSMGISFMCQIIDAPDFDFKPDTLLNRLRAKVIDAFGVDATGRKVEDGMDVGVVVYNQRTQEAYFAGAGRPVVIIRGSELIVHKGDRMPIGRYVRTDDFTCVKIELQKGDSVYLFSDGCVDQVGGERKRKLNSTNFYQFLVDINSVDFLSRKQKLEDYLLAWRGQLQQTDDMSLLAFLV